MQNETLSNFERKLLLIRSKKYCKKYFVTWIYSWDREEGPCTGGSPCVRVAIVDRNAEHWSFVLYRRIIQVNLEVAIIWPNIEIFMAQSIFPLPPGNCHFFCNNFKCPRVNQSIKLNFVTVISSGFKMKQMTGR